MHIGFLGMYRSSVTVGMSEDNAQKGDVEVMLESLVGDEALCTDKISANSSWDVEAAARLRSSLTATSCGELIALFGCSVLSENHCDAFPRISWRVLWLTNLI